MTTKRATKTPGATETTPEQTPAVEQTLLDEAPTQEVPTSDVGGAETTAQVSEPTTAELMQQIELLKQQIAAQQAQQAQQKQPKQAKAVAPHVPTSDASASNGRWVLTPNGWAIKEIV